MLSVSLNKVRMSRAVSVVVRMKVLRRVRKRVVDLK